MSILITFVLGCLAVVLCNANSTLLVRSDSSHRPPENQACLKKNQFQYYCPIDGKCHDGYARCSGSASKPIEPCSESDCEQSSSGLYVVKLYKAPLTRREDGEKLDSVTLCDGCNELAHHFIVYRGYAFEFGTYGQQTLDLLDPKYKYKDKTDVSIRDPTSTSRCTLSQVEKHTSFWLKSHNDYHPCLNNCQHYASSLWYWLVNNCEGKPQWRTCSKSQLRGRQSTNSSSLADENDVDPRECVCFSRGSREVFSFAAKILLIPLLVTLATFMNQ